MHINQDEPAGALKLSGTLDISIAEALRNVLAECVERDGNPTVDLSAVDGCDTAALQLLFSARESALQAKKRFRVEASSPAVVRACSALGLALAKLTGDEDTGLPDQMTGHEAAERGNDDAI